MSDPPSPAGSTRRTHLDGLAVGVLLTCCVLWGLNQVASKVALADVPPLAQAAMRSAGAAVLLALWSVARGVRLGPGNGTAPAGVLAGLLFGLEFGCIFWGLQYTSASRMGVFLYLAPFVVALGMPFISPAERLRPLQWLGLSAAFGGVGWALAEGFSAPVLGPRAGWGDLLGVAAALLWGGTTLLVRASRLASAPPEQTLFYQLAVSALVLALASWAVGEAWPAWHRLPVRTLLLLGFQTVVVSFASYLAWFWLVRHYPATRLAAFTLITPLASLVAGVGLLGEPLTLRLAVACSAVALGIALVNRRPRDAAPR
jgi:drug/metabolite transporter (DMT)-like permease